MIGLYDINSVCDLNFKERFNIYKEVGFKEVALYIDGFYNKPNENYVDIINYAREIGLNVKQVHIDYKFSNLICNNSTNEYFDYVSKKLEEAVKLNIPFVVAHASKGDNPPKISKIQLKKFKSMMNNFKNKPVVLCLENVRNNHNLSCLLNLNLKNVGMCFDLGHAHCYGQENALFDEFKNKICCSHFHNNFGKDTHNILSQGEIDYVFFLKQVKNVNSVCLECFPENTTLTKQQFAEFVEKCYKSIAAFE